MFATSEVRAGDNARAFDWTGYYLGAHFGGALGTSNVRDPYGSAIYGDTIRSPGALAGVQAGYDHQIGNWVLGLGMDLSRADLRGANTCYQVDPLTFFGATCGYETDWLGTATGRLGMAVGSQGRGLIYGKGGLAWESGRITQGVNNAAGGDTGAPNATSRNAFSQFGWTLGAGAEYALGGNWSTSFEYDYMRFANRNVASPDADYGSDAPDGRRAGFDQNLHAFKLGLNYRFGNGLAPDTTGSTSGKGSSTTFTSEIEATFGGRYVHGWGHYVQNLGRKPAQAYPITVSRLTYDDQKSDGAELFGRVDFSNDVMIKALIGRGTGHGKMNDEDWYDGLFYDGGPYSNTLQTTNNTITYWTVDVGYDWLRTPDYKLTSFVGFNRYYQKMPTFGCTAIFEGGNTNCYPTPSDPKENGISEFDTWNSLRVGVAAEVELVKGLKLSADAAYLPRVWFTGTDDHGPGSGDAISPESGTGTGVQLEAALSYDVTSNLSVGLGGRYWAMSVLNGTSDFNSKANFIPTRFTTEHSAVFAQVALKLGGPSR